MRVFVVEASGKGGMIHYDYLLCRALAQQGVDVSLITSTSYELGALAHNFQVVRLMHLWDPRSRRSNHLLLQHLQRGVRGVRYVIEWLRLLKYLLSERPDIVIFGEVRFGFESLFLKCLKKNGLTLADIVHDVRTYDTRPKTVTLVQDHEVHIQKYRKIYNLFDAMFVHDRSSYHDFLNLYGIPVDKVHQIPLGTNEIILEVTPSHTPEQLQNLYGIPADKPVVLFFGTLTKYKGVADIVRAFPSVLKKTAAHLVIAGFPAKDIDVEALREEAERLGIHGHVTWCLEYIENERVASLMALADVVVLPYRAITQSAILQVAYACGRPVVGTKVGGLPDVIEDGRSGLLVGPGNLSALAAGISRILSDPVLAEKFGRRALELSQTVYSWHNIAATVKRVLEGLQAGHSG